MKTILILHNPKAGDEDHQKKELIDSIKLKGYQYQYASVQKDDWKKIDGDIDIILVVGGDGTVRKVVKFLLQRTLLDKKMLISLLPMGTANNIALTLGLSYNLANLLKQWDVNKTRKMDVGAVRGSHFKNFFLESLGYGILPKLMRTMEEIETSHLKRSEDEITFALHTLLGLSSTYKAKHAIIKVDGKQYEGNFLLIEVMNICSLGPNLILAPNADIADGMFDIVLLREEQRQDFISYIGNVLTSKTKKVPWQSIQGKQIEIQWDGSWVHIDDELVRLDKSNSTQIEARPNILELLI
ncbi:diacylglycerol/lipid kinase family protein [Olivibacter domesticus]|uniref:Diacylglycerol kinase family enzyme n=1 Tax=Olivibacter domesticus TaxID=407022 RepID=A0A1H7HV03_OLID1|nr:diacylglycerol kinase family protein [Olivibacter domesticus]SEK52940.1 Diacylglycerol kinase family enzyme [Olivibacter domesticus]